MKHQITILSLFILLCIGFINNKNAVAQNTPPAGTKFIELTVDNNATVRLDLRAAQANTLVWI